MRADKDGRRTARTIPYAWLLVILLLPFLSGGVVVGDEAYLLKAVHGFAASPLSFGAYARSQDGWYITHHVLWFVLLYISDHVASFLHINALVTEGLISCQTVVAGLSSIVLCYVFLIRRKGMTQARAAWVVLGFYAGGYGVYTFCMGGAVEFYMLLAFALRLFLVERDLSENDAWKLAVLDFILVSLKLYSLIFLVATWPLLRFSPRARIIYFGAFGVLLIVLATMKVWLWNPYYNDVLAHVFVSESVVHFFQQFFSPWTGLIPCLPIVLVLIWHEKSQRRTILFKLLGLCGCAAVFSLYGFFNGGLAGGRYIFPFVLALLPEIAVAASRLLDLWPRAAWVLPVAVLAFLPVAVFGYPYFPANTIAASGNCRPEHPVIYSWNIAVAKIAGRPSVTICFDRQKYVMPPRDAASPHLASWRIAYMLEGGHSNGYRKIVHDETQKRHDAWGASLSRRLMAIGLGSPIIWDAIGFLPAIFVLWLSLLTAKRVCQPLPSS